MPINIIVQVVVEQEKLSVMAITQLHLQLQKQIQVVPLNVLTIMIHKLLVQGVKCVLTVCSNHVRWDIIKIVLDNPIVSAKYISRSVPIFYQYYILLISSSILYISLLFAGNGKVCSPGYYCTDGAQSASPSSGYDCGDIKHYCPNSPTQKGKVQVSLGYYTTCGTIVNPEDDLIACPESRRSSQLSCQPIENDYTCPGNGRRERWIATTTCTNVPIVSFYFSIFSFSILPFFFVYIFSQHY
jgi:hypothetical protein